MDEGSLNYGSDAAGGTPDANSILAQPPLQDSPGQGEGAESMCTPFPFNCSKYLNL